MTVRAGVHESPWGQIDYIEALRPLAIFIRRVTPYILAVVLAGSAVFLAMSCKGSTVAFSNDGKVASLAVAVADTPQETSKGLMYRTSLGADSGMLFDFKTNTAIDFYMKNTSIPLSIAFIDSSGEILAIRNMKPYDLTPVASPQPFRYAIEVNRGWFAKKGITPGYRATIDI